MQEKIQECGSGQIVEKRLEMRLLRHAVEPLCLVGADDTSAVALLVVALHQLAHCLTHERVGLALCGLAPLQRQQDVFPHLVQIPQGGHKVIDMDANTGNA